MEIEKNKIRERERKRERYALKLCKKLSLQENIFRNLKYLGFDKPNKLDHVHHTNIMFVLEKEVNWNILEGGPMLKRF